MADVRDASYPPLLVPSRLVLGEVARTALSMGDRPVGGVAWMRRAICRSFSGRGRVECRCRLRPSHRSGLGCLTVGAGPTASKQLHVTWAIVEEWRSIATRDDSKLRASDSYVKIALRSRLVRTQQ